MRLIAVRVNPVIPEVIFTRVWSAFAKPRIFSQRRRDSSADSPCLFELVLCIVLSRINHVDVSEQRDRTPMRHSVQLLRLALTVTQRRAEFIRALSAEKCQRIPEIGSSGLIGDVSQHSCPFTVLDFPK